MGRPRTKEEEMHALKDIHRVAVLLTAVAALAYFAGSVQAANSHPAGMTKAADRALMLRSEALNRQYGLGFWTDKPAAMGWQDYRALVLRSKALNAKYGLGGAHVVASTPPAGTVAENGFAWGDFAIGAAATLALVLVAIGVFAASRLIPRTRVST
jgi:hypothetical protein